MTERRAGTEFGERALSYEENIQSGVLREAHALGVLVRLPVPAPLVGAAERGLASLREGRAVTDENARGALHLAIDGLLSEYAGELASRRSRAAEGENIKLPPVPALTSLERETLKSFLTWVLKEDSRRRREGHRGADLDAAGEAIGE